MIISVDAEKEFDKIHYPLMITLLKNYNRREFPQQSKEHL